MSSRVSLSIWAFLFGGVVVYGLISTGALELGGPQDQAATWAGVVVGSRGAGACPPGRYQNATGGGRSMVPVWAEASNASTAFIKVS